jgi:hypothetical protein
MELSRRRFLTTVGALAMGTALPPPVTRRLPADLDLLHEHSRSLAQRLRSSMPPLLVLGDARCRLDRLETLLVGATGWQRTRLHRTAALTASIAAHASCLADDPHTLWLLDRADQHARDANDGPLQAQALLLRAAHVGEAAYAVDVGTENGRQLLITALRHAGSPHLLRALIRYELAWEYAALGERKAAHAELVAADVEHGLATAVPDVIEIDSRTLPVLGAGLRGSVLRRLSLHDEAIVASTHALSDGPVQWQSFRMLDIARCHAAKGEVDAAAAVLEEAYLLHRQAGLRHRQGRVRAIRASLPDSTALRQLDAVICG